jgi:ribosomal protein S18 acetylase RimI-like enzyme
VALRPATSQDVPRLVELVDAAYSHYVGRLGGLPRPMTEDYEDVVRRHQAIVDELHGRIIGLVVLTVEGDALLVHNVAVDPACQGRGVGRGLLEYAEGEARRGGYDSIALDTHERMTENLALYRRIGYVDDDRRRPGPAFVVHLRKPLP